MTKVLVAFSQGVEEIEFVTIVDILRRADIEVTTASLDGLPVQGRSNIIMHADCHVQDVTQQAWDMIVLPGGLPNAHLLRDNQHVQNIVLRLRKEGKSIAAICAAPTALAAYGVTANMRVTAYPSCQQAMQTLQPSSVYVDDTVVEDDFLITSQGAGTAIEFSLRLLAKLCGENKAQEVRQSIVA